MIVLVTKNHKQVFNLTKDEAETTHQLWSKRYGFDKKANRIHFKSKPEYYRYIIRSLNKASPREYDLIMRWLNPNLEY